MRAYIKERHAHGAALLAGMVEMQSTCSRNNKKGPTPNGLWKYGLDAFRYLIRPGWFDPFWTVINAQTFSMSSPTYDYRRHYKTARGFNGKSCELLLGNFITLAARQRMSSRNTWRALKALPFFDVLVEHYQLKGKRESDIRKRVSELLEERYLRWGRAI